MTSILDEVHPNIAEKFRANYFSAWDEDELSIRYGNPAPPEHRPFCVRHFIAKLYHELASQGETKVSLDMTFSDLMRMNEVIQDLAIDKLCRQAVEFAAKEACSVSLFEYERDETMKKMIDEASTVLQQSTGGSAINLLVKEYWPETLQRNGARRLRDFFYKKRSDGSYYFGIDRLRQNRRPSKKYPSPSGTIDLNVRDEDRGISAVRPYEWQAVLRSHAGEPLAAAAGTLFRTRKSVCANQSFWINLADEISDLDMVLMHAFCEFWEGAQLLENGDVTLLGHWERFEHSPKGCGKELLEGALGKLAERFPRLRYVCQDIRLPQFRDWNMKDEPVTISQDKERQLNRFKAYLKITGLDQPFEGRLQMLPVVPAIDDHSSTVSWAIGEMAAARHAITRLIRV